MQLIGNEIKLKSLFRKGFCNLKSVLVGSDQERSLV